MWHDGSSRVRRAARPGVARRLKRRGLGRHSFATPQAGFPRLVEGASRQRTPNEIALSLVLSAFTLIFLIVVVALWPMAANAESYMGDYLGAANLKSLGTDIPTLVEVYEQHNGRQPDADALETYRAILALTYTYQKAIWVPEETPDEAVELLRSTA